MEETIRSLALSQKESTKRYICPACSAERKHSHDPCLSITVEGSLAKWQCWHCNFAGAMRLTERRPLFQSTPAPIIMPEMEEDENEAAYAWLSTRGITRSIAKEAGVIGGNKFIDGKNQKVCGFVYKKGSEPYAIKWRAVAEKGFIQTGSANTFWQIDRVTKGTQIVIVEGEVDCLSLLQAGVTAVSVPNGAPNTVSHADIPKSAVPSDKKYKYMWEAKAILDDAPKIIIATDSDNPGNILAEELARRIGRAKCWRVLWPDGCKDANDVLRTHGSQALRDCIENAQPWPVKGLYDAEHFFDRVVALYDKGLPKGESTGFKCIDEIYTVVPGQLTVVTGSPGSGKSTMIDNFMVNMAKNKDWKFAVCSFENPPEVHIAKLAGIYAGKPFFDGPTPRMSVAARDEALTWVREHFFFLHQSDGTLATLDDIVDLARTSIMRYGIQGLVIDPYNFIDRGGESSETDWVSDALTKLKVLSMGHDIHTWIMAHPTKMRRKDDGSFPIPTGYDISGSAHWFNKADMGLTVHRPDFLSSKTEVHMWKVRFSFTGKVGKTEMTYDAPSGIYLEKFTGCEFDDDLP